MSDIGLLEPAIYVALPPFNVDLPPADHAEALALLEDYTNLFLAGPHKFGLLTRKL